MHQKVKLIFQITSLSELPIPQEGDLSRLPVLENGFDNVRSYYLERRSVTAARGHFRLCSQQPLYGFGPAFAWGDRGMHLRLAADVPANRRYDILEHITDQALCSRCARRARWRCDRTRQLRTENGLSAAALAFLAGYAVEPVFATLDAFASAGRGRAPWWPLPGRDGSWRRSSARSARRPPDS